MKNAILAIRNAEILTICKRLMADLDVAFSVVSDATELKLSLKRRSPDFIISEEYVESEPIFDLIPQWPKICWIVLMNLLETWGGARFLAALAPRVAVLTARPAIYDILDAVHAALEEDDVWFGQMKNEFARSWTKSLEAFPGTFGLNVTDENHRFAQASWLKMHFDPEFPAPCQAVSNLAVLCRIVRMKQSGILEFRRENGFLRILWYQGQASGIETDIRQLDFPWFAAGWKPSGNQDGKEGDDPKDPATELKCRRDWIAASLEEAVMWQRGDVTWKQALTLKNEAMIPQNAWNALANRFVFRVPSRELLDTIRALLPFSFKLNTSIDDVCSLFSYTETKAVVERLQKSDTLEELLVYLPQGYPIHQTIYLLLAQSCLDID